MSIEYEEKDTVFNQSDLYIGPVSPVISFSTPYDASSNQDYISDTPTTAPDNPSGLDILIQGQYQSPNFVTTISGFSLSSEGNVEFNNGFFRGTLVIGTSGGARVEISGNDINMYDSSTGGTGTISGDTASLNFIRADGGSGTFVMQKRHGKNDDRENVFEMFFSAAAAGSQLNYIFIGRDGIGETINNYSDVVVLHGIQDVRAEVNRVNQYNSRPTFFTGDYNKIDGTKQGVVSWLVSEGNDGFVFLGHLAELLTFSDSPNFAVGDIITGNATGATAKIIYKADANDYYANHTSYGVEFNPATDNTCTTNGAGGGTGTGNLSANSYVQLPLIYTDNSLNVRLGNPLLPDADNAYDIGSASFRIKDLWVGGTIHGGDSSVITMTANQTLSIGDPVGISNGQEDFVSLAGFEFKTLSGAFPFAVSGSRPPVFINTNKFVLAFLRSSNSHVYVVIGTVDTTTLQVSFGTAVEVNSGSGSISAFSVCKLATDKFMVLEIDGTTKAIPCTVSGSTITAGSVQNSTFSAGDVIVKSGSSNNATALIAAGGNTAKVFGMTISGTTVTFGTLTTVEAVGSLNLAGMMVVGTDKFVVGYTTGPRACVISQSGTTTTAGSPQAYTGGSGSGMLYGSLATDTFYGQLTSVLVFFATISGTVITFGAGQTGTGMYDDGSGYFVRLSSNIYISATISGGTSISFTFPEFYNYDLNGKVTTSGYVIDMASSSTDLQYWITGMARGFVGIATTNATRGGSVSVKISGEATVNQSLILGDFHYVLQGIFTRMPDSTFTNPSNYSQWKKVQSSGTLKVIL